ncbi:NAD(P)H dehydrogenase (quinone) [Actinacidiphila yanglinensis]|uniref:NAD(P)H dehydrogenase (Quinone) n=1 Tax=Actinacidiphila yanglinensis TaxID=310779 RepID=A0A1H6CUG6_9ACTN|nr:NAD(P)H-binding protein [Actinacidiphila yanglinensis]SEG76729.1 NAD(P)H dehydrogenase (quinone) [Actinacidiphila yanglinensis]
MAIAVTGGNGEFGSAVIAHLRNLTDQPVVATVRDVTKGRQSAGVDYRPGDFDDPESLRISLSGVDTVLVNATFFGPDPARRLPRVRAAIGAAADAGVGRIVLTSWPDLENATMPAVQDYRRLEAAAKSASPSWTILRLGVGLGDALARDVVWGRKAGELVAPAKNARVTPAAVTDLAEAAAAVLTQAGHEGEILEMTGPDAIGWDDVAKLAEVPFRALPDDEYVAYLTQTFNLPEAAARQLTALYADFRGPWASTPTTTVTNLIGHPALPGTEAVQGRVAMFPAG